MQTLTKADLAQKLVEELDLTHQQGRMVVDTFFSQITECLIAGETVKLSGFGNFEVRQKSSRPGRNPKTGETVEIEARRVVTFRAGQKFRKCVEDTQCSNSFSKSCF